MQHQYTDDQLFAGILSLCGAEQSVNSSAVRLSITPSLSVVYDTDRQHHHHHHAD